MASLAGLMLVAGCKKHDYPLPPSEVNKIKHVVVIYLENHSFDNLYGQFPGADGLSDAKARNIIQVEWQTLSIPARYSGDQCVPNQSCQ